MDEGPDFKRLKREHAEASFENFKANAFIDYMMQATEEDKTFWVHYFKRLSFETKGWTWSWIDYGQSLLLHNTTFSRLSHGREVPSDILSGAWLLREHDQLYQNANATFWILIATRLDSVKDVKSLSLVSKLLNQVMRKDVVYKQWITNLFYDNPVQHHYCNPCPSDMPLWKQFLFLSGEMPLSVYKRLVHSNAKWFFFVIVSKGGHGYLIIPNGCVFYEESFSIRDGSTNKLVCEKVEYLMKYASHGMSGLSIIYSCSTSFFLRLNMEHYGMKSEF